MPQVQVPNVHPRSTLVLSYLSAAQLPKQPSLLPPAISVAPLPKPRPHQRSRRRPVKYPHLDPGFTPCFTPSSLLRWRLYFTTCLPSEQSHRFAPGSPTCLFLYYSAHSCHSRFHSSLILYRSLLPLFFLQAHVRIRYRPRFFALLHSQLIILILVAKKLFLTALH